MVAASGATRRVAEYVADTRLEDVPAKAIEGAKLVALDTLGCGLAALDQPIARAIMDYVEGLGGRPDATVLGAGGFKTAAPMAAMANGCLVNILDFDGFFHVPTHTLPAALAVGETVGASGRDVLEAFLLAAEVANRLQKVIEARRTESGGPTFRGWYHVSLYGPLAAALAAGKLLTLDVPHLQGAIGAAACGSGGFRPNLGAKAKSFNSGNAAAVGVHAAFLSRAGVTGFPEILESRMGLVDAVCLPGEFDWEPLSSLGSAYELAEDSLGTKKYPAVGPTQEVIGALARLRERERVNPEEIDTIELHLPGLSAALGSARDAEPEDELAAGFSWPYIVAATAVDGSFRVDHLSRASLDNPAIRAMEKRVRLIATPSAGERGRLNIRLRDGRTLESTIERGFGRLDREEMVTKYRDNAVRRLSAADVAGLERAIMGMDRLASIGELTSAMAGPPSAG